jgi:hypothetical protein
VQDAEIPESEPLQFVYSFVPFITARSDFIEEEVLIAMLQNGSPKGQLPIFVWRKLSRDITNTVGCVDYDQEHWAVPWVVWDDTASDMGIGVYAWRRFKRGEVIGVYSGKLLIQSEVDSLPNGFPNDAIINVPPYFVDGRQHPTSEELHSAVLHPWPGMGAHLLNDGKDHGINNVQLTAPLGVMQVTRNINAVYHSLTFINRNVAERAAANVDSQLLWPYGDEFWQHGNAGAVAAAVAVAGGGEGDGDGDGDGAAAAAAAAAGGGVAEGRPVKRRKLARK